MLRMSAAKVYLAPGTTDMRAGIDRLSMTVQGILELDPFSGHLFGFCNRRRDTIKVLYWDRNGFCLWHKRLEKHRFCWPERASALGNTEKKGFKVTFDTRKKRGVRTRLDRYS